MRRLPFSPILVPVVLMACATGDARPIGVTLERDMLEVEMSDGSTCRGPAPVTGAETGWQGGLQDCPWPYAYRVEIDPNSNPVRLVLQEVLSALGGAEVLTPIATVAIDLPTGSTIRFQTPERVDFDDGNDQ